MDVHNRRRRPSFLSDISQKSRQASRSTAVVLDKYPEECSTKWNDASLREEVVHSARENREGIIDLSPLQYLIKPGACGKAPVVMSNLPPKQQGLCSGEAA